MKDKDEYQALIQQLIHIVNELLATDKFENLKKVKELFEDLTKQLDKKLKAIS